MKICFVINEFNFFFSHRFDLLAELAKKNHVTLITDTSNALQENIKKCLSHKIYIQHLKQRSASEKISYLKYFFSLRNLIYQYSYDHVLFVTIETCFFGALLRNKNRISNKYYLVTGIGPFLDKKDLKFKILKRIYSNVFNKEKNNLNSKFIFQNLDNKDYFISSSFASEKNSVVIKGSGIKQTGKLKKRFQENDGLIKFCFAGELTSSKGLEELLEASNNLYQQNYQFKLNIAGKYLPGKSDYISNELYIRMQKSKYINYYGIIDYSKMSNFYMDSDIFILPSYGEGLPKSALEAASHGLPLILTDVPGSNECIFENGYLIPAKDPIALEKKMKEFINNKEILRSMSTKSLFIVKEKFELTKIVNQYLELFNNKMNS
tara:strand:+ start:8062 stop:9195 length:1134 start_codon:yes stop_codon:yes gene_type:complete